MIRDYVKTGFPLMLDQTADQLLSNPAFEEWSGAPPNDQPDDWTNVNFANITEDADGMSITAGGFSCEQDVMTVGRTYLAITNIISYTSGTIQLRQGGGANIIDTYTSAGINAIEFEAEETEFVVMSPTAGAMAATVRFVYLIDITDGFGFDNMSIKQECCSGHEYFTITDRRHLPPFQIKSTIEDPLPAIVLYDAETDTPVAPQPAAIADILAEVDVVNDGTYAWYIYDAYGNIANDLPLGEYYLLFTATDGLSTDIYYSQAFRVCDFTLAMDESESVGDCEFYGDQGDLVMIEWWNECDFDDIIYQYEFRNRIFFDELVETPRPEITKATSERDSRMFGDYISVKKFYQLKILVPEFVYDAIIRLPLYGDELSRGHVTITLPDGSCGQLKEINITAEWQDNSCLCHMIVEFLDEEYPVIAGNCCDDLDLSETT